MRGTRVLQHHFVPWIPEELVDGHLYICLEHATAVHLCCCGCRSEVVTPLAPNDWLLTFDGETVSLSPSIGNWSFACRSHYWIRNNRVAWARQWRDAEVAAARGPLVTERRRRPTGPLPDAGDLIRGRSQSQKVLRRIWGWFERKLGLEEAKS